jgi:hypothetical protein
MRKLSLTDVGHSFQRTCTLLPFPPTRLAALVEGSRSIYAELDSILAFGDAESAARGAIGNTKVDTPLT